MPKRAKQSPHGRRRERINLDPDAAAMVHEFRERMLTRMCEPFAGNPAALRWVHESFTVAEAAAAMIETCHAGTQAGAAIVDIVRFLDRLNELLADGARAMRQPTREELAALMAECTIIGATPGAEPSWTVN